MSFCSVKFYCLINGHSDPRVVFLLQPHIRADFRSIPELLDQRIVWDWDCLDHPALGSRGRKVLGDPVDREQLVWLGRGALGVPRAATR